MGKFEVTFYGTRGSTPTSGPEFTAHGGNTPCVALKINKRLIILDAGTGIVGLGQELKSNKITDIDVFITHGHYDHVQGLPFFAPLLIEGVNVNIWFAGCEGADTGQSLVEKIFAEPFLPFGAKDIACNIQYKSLPKNGSFALDGEITVKTAPLHHPGGCTALRFEANGLSFIYAPDFEHDNGAADEALVGFLSEANFAVLDATHTVEDYNAYKGFGHTYWEKALEIAHRANLVRWAYFHHHHRRSDNELNDIAQKALKLDNRAVIARDGLSLELV